MKKRMSAFIGIILFLFLLILPLIVEGAYLENVPGKVVQPNGVKLSIYASGDEFYNWLHDKSGYTIIQHPKTGYYVYAIERDGDLLPSNFIATPYYALNLASIRYLNIPKYLKHSPDKRISPEEQFPEGSPANIDKIVSAPKTGTINNIVIFIRFSDESEFLNTISTYESMFNDSSFGSNSMYNYFT